MGTRTCGETLHYLPPLPSWAVRVTLNRMQGEGIDREFIGEYDGTPVSVGISGANAIRVRKAIEDHGSVVWDLPHYDIHELDDDGRTYLEAARVRGRERAQVIFGAFEGARRGSR